MTGGSVSFEVDLDGLLLLVQHLTNIRRDIFQLGQGGPPDVVGGMGQQVVQQALDDFRSAWAYGLDVIGQDMDSACSLAQGAHDAYTNVETAVASAAAPGQPGVDGKQR